MVMGPNLGMNVLAMSAFEKHIFHGLCDTQNLFPEQGERALILLH